AIDYLSKKIIHGGAGVWGEVPMAAHPNLSEDDAKTLAKYVLLLKK
ncbi:MAG: cytochrome c class I, partial [Chitinophagaceae bacterium]